MLFRRAIRFRSKFSYFIFKKILVEVNGEYTKSLAKTCISIATTYYQLGKMNESIEYFEKAEKLFILFGNAKVAKEIQQKKEDLIFNKNNN